MKAPTAQTIVAVATLGSVTVLAGFHAWLVLAAAFLFGVVTVASLSGSEERRRIREAAQHQQFVALVAMLELGRRSSGGGQRG